MKYFLLLFTLLCLNKLQAQSSAEIQWLNQHISAIQSVNAGNRFDDLETVEQIVGHANIVALGECTHGSREVFQMKHRLLEYLVTQKGFTIFALETDFAFGQILNEYVQTGKADSLTIRYATGFAVWNTKEVWEMIEWIRTYNQSHLPKIQFAGVDMQNPFPNLLNLNYFAIQQADSILSNQLFSLFNQHQLIKKSWVKIPLATQQQLLKLSQEIENNVRARNAPASIQQNARVLLQLAHMLQSKMPGSKIRDEAMATNTAWIVQENPLAKVVVWAHNAHIAKIEGQTMGHFLARKFGSAYVSIGFATGKGTFSTVDPEGTFNGNNQLLAPIPNSFEAWFDQVNQARFILNLHATESSTNESKWLTQKKWFRLIGAFLTSANPKHQFRWHQPLPEAFDGLIYLKQTSASQPNSAGN